MTYLQAVPDLPAEDDDAPVKIETYGDLFRNLHAMLTDAVVTDGDIGAALLRLAFLAVEHEDVSLPGVKR